MVGPVRPIGVSAVQPAAEFAPVPAPAAGQTAKIDVCETRDRLSRKLRARTAAPTAGQMAHTDVMGPAAVAPAAQAAKAPAPSAAVRTCSQPQHPGDELC